MSDIKSSVYVSAYQHAGYVFKERKVPLKSSASIVTVAMPCDKCLGDAYI